MTDLYDLATDELVEAKASAGRTYVRAALGQVLDYSRYLDPKGRAVLVPTYPGDDLADLLNHVPGGRHLAYGQRVPAP